MLGISTLNYKMSLRRSEATAAISYFSLITTGLLRLSPRNDSGEITRHWYPYFIRL